MISGKSLLLGFIAGALAVLLFHQGMVGLLYLLGSIPNPPWNLGTMRGGLLPIPVLVNQMFWGGLWGMGFAVLWPMIPVGAAWLRGAVYGLLGPFLLGNGLLVPFFKGGAYFWGGQPQRMLIGSLIGAAFGAGLGLILPRLGKR
jgi:hypothetical protein